MQINLELIFQELAKLDSLEITEKVETINTLRLKIKEYSPFKSQPIDCVLWVKKVRAYLQPKTLPLVIL